MEIPYEVTPRRDTGLFNAKLGIWLFLASEVMLFGGLFSAYVFLRVGVVDGVDPPWPWGINVHKTFVVIGFINTVVLIVSSVFVVFGWVALKERKYRKFQIYMYLTVLCAVIFMGFKMVEYRSKLTQHHDIRLTDDSLLEGKIIGDSADVPFDAEGAEISLHGSIPGFPIDIDGPFPKLTAKWTEVEWVEGDDGVTLELKDEEKEITSASGFRNWFLKQRTRVAKDLAKAKKIYRREIAVKEKAQYAGTTDFKEPSMVQIPSLATVTAEEPFHLSCRRLRVRPVEKGEGGGKDSLTYLDGTKILGKAGDDRVRFIPHKVDMQLVPLHRQKDSMAWDVIGDSHAKEAWFKNRDEKYEEVEEYYAEREKAIPEKMLRGYYINIQSIHGKEHEKPFWEEFIHEFKAGMGLADDGHHHDEKGDHKEIHHKPGEGDSKDHGKKPHAKPSEKGGAQDDADHDHGHIELLIPRKLIAHVNSHGPRNSNYYAIYFTMTALHGLHVVGGALVLLYFAIFGKKIYRKNPEHLANRVEVGGLFWHFVDLIWIFLFPIMYLL